MGGLPKIENFKICQNLLRWTKTNIESNFGGYQATTGYQKKKFSRSDGENAIFAFPCISLHMLEGIAKIAFSPSKQLKFFVWHPALP